MKPGEYPAWHKLNSIINQLDAFDPHTAELVSEIQKKQHKKWNIEMLYRAISSLKTAYTSLLRMPNLAVEIRYNIITLNNELYYKQKKREMLECLQDLFGEHANGILGEEGEEDREED